MIFSECSEAILHSMVRDILSLEEGEHASIMSLLSKYTEEQPGFTDLYPFYLELVDELTKKGCFFVFDQIAKDGRGNIFGDSFHVIHTSEIQPVGNHAPMGWNSWDCYGASVTEEDVKRNADFMAENLKQYGYEYVVVDIEWAQPKPVGHSYEPFTDLIMDEYGRLLPAVNRFPSAADGKGFGPLADYVHGLGLKFGIHILRGIPREAVGRNLPVYGSSMTARQIAQRSSICAWNTDMYGISGQMGGKAYYDSIFRLYAEWGVDFIKIDDICRELPAEREELCMVSQALQDCGREMVFSLSPGPALLEESETYKKTAHMWRITDDFWDQWELLYNMFERAEKWCIHTGSGHYPDADMLPVGLLRCNDGIGKWTHFTENEQISMISLWCIFRAPLIIGGEMTSFDDFTMKLLTNRDILHMHSHGRHPHPVWRKDIGSIEHTLWTAQNIDGGQYAAVFNLGEKDSDFMLSLSDLEIEGNPKITELWTGENITGANGKIHIQLPGHGAGVYLLK